MVVYRDFMKTKTRKSRCRKTYKIPARSTKKQRGGHQGLIKAAIDGDIDQVNKLISDANEADIYDRTPIWYASGNGHLEVVQALIAAKADVNRANAYYGRTPISQASENGHLKIVQALVAAGADVNKANNDGWTPITEASSKGHLEIVKALIAASGADANKANNYGRTPIWWASHNGRLEIVQALIAAGVDVNKADNDDETPIFWASHNGRLDVVQALIAAGADVNKASNNGYTPISQASSNGHLKIVQALIAAKADVNKASNNGDTPISRASSNGHLKIVQALIAAGGLTSSPTSILRILEQVVKNKDVAVIKIIVKAMNDDSELRNAIPLTDKEKIQDMLFTFAETNNDDDLLEYLIRTGMKNRIMRKQTAVGQVNKLVGKMGDANKIPRDVQREGILKFLGGRKTQSKRTRRRKTQSKR